MHPRPHDHTRPLDFQAERQAGSTSWTRARPHHPETEIEQVAWNHYHVTLPDSEDVYRVHLERDHGRWIGTCHHHTPPSEPRHHCQGYAYHPGPCAHLCTVRKAAYLQLPDRTGRIIRVWERLEVQDAHRIASRYPQQESPLEAGE